MATTFGCLRQRFNPAEIGVAEIARVVGMNADGGVDPVVLRRQIERGAAGRFVNRPD